jgi:rare lipoprotein A (peptidoglycan hydrolase)
VPFRYVTHNDPDMDSGTRKVVQQGAEGLKAQRFSVLLEDGVRVNTRLLGETVVRSARDHIVRVGTKEPEYSGSGSATEGIASWFEADGLVAAHRTLPLGTVVKVENLENGKTVSVRINQRGPFVDGRVIDLSDDAFERLAPLGKGTIKAKVHT